jgi:hypothetical protein
VTDADARPARDGPVGPPCRIRRLEAIADQLGRLVRPPAAEVSGMGTSVLGKGNLGFSYN